MIKKSNKKPQDKGKPVVEEVSPEKPNQKLLRL